MPDNIGKSSYCNLTQRTGVGYLQLIHTDARKILFDYAKTGSA